MRLTDDASLAETSSSDPENMTVKLCLALSACPLLSMVILFRVYLIFLHVFRDLRDHYFSESIPTNPIFLSFFFFFFFYLFIYCKHYYMYLLSKYNVGLKNNIYPNYMLMVI